MTLAVDLGRKATKQTNKQTNNHWFSLLLNACELQGMSHFFEFTTVRCFDLIGSL